MQPQYWPFLEPEFINVYICTYAGFPLLDCSLPAAVREEDGMGAGCAAAGVSPALEWVRAVPPQAAQPAPIPELGDAAGGEQS